MLVFQSLRYGEDTSAKPLFSVVIDNKVSYPSIGGREGGREGGRDNSLFLMQGVRQDMLVAPSFVAVVIAVFIWWLAYTTKTKLQE